MCTYPLSVLAGHAGREEDHIVVSVAWVSLLIPVSVLTLRGDVQTAEVSTGGFASSLASFFLGFSRKESKDAGY